MATCVVCITVMQVAQMNPALRDAAVLEGDVLRACTCTTLVYPTRALFGAKPPKRTIVLYGALFAKKEDPHFHTRL